MINTVRGTKDIIPASISDWQFVENVFRNASKIYGYKELRTPIFEKTEVFSRSIGDDTDIVNKEMYTFTDKGGESITLRPEQTAALVRAVIQNSLDRDGANLRLFYIGPYFRYERPQKGRLRQFHQYGAESIGSPNPEADVEILLLANKIIKELGIKEYKLLINTLGTENSRKNYKTSLISFLNDNKELLSEESKMRLDTNPLRVLDSKSEKDIEVMKNAPIILDYLDEDSFNHFDTVKKLLTAEAVDFTIQPRLVRGLDYYCHTVFEFQSSALGAQDAFGGGGRYDGLFAQLGGKPNPAVGFAMGIERILLILEGLNVSHKDENECDIYVICGNPDLSAKANSIAEMLRNKNLRVITDINRRSMKSQFKESNRFKARYSIIVAEDELTRNSVILKNMLTTEQTEIEISKINELDLN